MAEAGATPRSSSRSDRWEGDSPLAVARPFLRWVLWQRFAPQSTPAEAPPPLPETSLLLQGAKRHRLAALIAAHAEGAGLPTPLLAQLGEEARREQLQALPLIALALEILPILQAAGVRVLVVKGPALAMQTIGRPLGRGGGDLDLLLAPQDLPAAVALLTKRGFESPAGLFPRDLTSFWGRYARWAGHELSLHRPGSPWLDLHWALGTLRTPLPRFESLWKERTEVLLNGRSLPTLGLRHAFLHACLHAASDQWMNLHHLLDVVHLAQQLPPDAQGGLRRWRFVRLSCAAAYDASGCTALLAFTDLERADCRWAVARAGWTQERPPRLGADGAWHPGHWLAMVIHRASLSPSPLDWLRVVARFSLLPAAFNDPLTGHDRGLAGMLQARWRRLQERLRERF
ncbi:MAG: nucleotidyltransferase family protein [Cyanobacteriota bacterium]|nr:nucleotidyltransferase family protein [Cyanobacteriota bacterium]